MKKAIVLLVTLFFISSISLFLVKFMDDTHTFLEKQNYVYENTQVVLLIKNAKNEVAKLIKEKKADIDDILVRGALDQDLPINENIKLKISVDKYKRVDINDMKKEDSKTVENLLLSNEIYDYALFKDIYNESLQNKNQLVVSKKQLNDIINTFLIRSYDYDTFPIDDIGFLPNGNLYEVNLEVAFNNTKANAYYVLTNNEEVRYFDISFK